MLSEMEIDQVFKAIRPCFNKYVVMFDKRKYPTGIYERLLRAFRKADRVKAGDIRDAILWKFGHMGKSRIPGRQESLISDLQHRWPKIISGLDEPAQDVVFERLSASAGGPSRYITTSFLLHLLRPGEIPIIDQHNFRAMNHFLKTVRQAWRSKSRPSTYADLAALSGFGRDILSHWKTFDAATVPSEQELDRFFMMFGKSLKQQKRHPPFEKPPHTRNMKGIKRQTENYPSFQQIYDCLKRYGPARCVSSRGTKYVVQPEITAGRPTIIGCPRTGEVRIHEDCWGKPLTCQGSRAGGIYNGDPSIYDWFNEKAKSST